MMSTFLWWLGIVSWIDCIELMIITFFVYLLLSWLALDSTGVPILSFYSYIVLMAVSYYSSLTIVFMGLVLGLPIFLLFLITIHQRSLQKNYITTRVLKPYPETSYFWLDEYMRLALYLAYQERDIIWIVERHETVRDVIKVPFFINAPLQESLGKLLLDQCQEKKQELIWIHHKGFILGWQVAWIKPVDDVWLTDVVKLLPVWQQQALFLTSITDALVIRIAAGAQNCVCIMQGTIVENITASQAFALVKKYLIAQEQELIKRSGTISESSIYHETRDRARSYHEQRST